MRPATPAVGGGSGVPGLVDGGVDAEEGVCADDGEEALDGFGGGGYAQVGAVVGGEEQPEEHEVGEGDAAGVEDDAWVIWR